MKYQLEKRSNISWNCSATNEQPIGEENDLQWVKCLRLIEGKSTGCKLTMAEEQIYLKIHVPSGSLGRPDSFLRPSPVWPNTPYIVKIIRQFLTPLIFSVTINNRSSPLNLITGPVRCYLRTRVSFGLTRKYMNKCIKFPSILWSSALWVTQDSWGSWCPGLLNLCLCFHKCFSKNMNQHPLAFYHRNPET